MENPKHLPHTHDTAGQYEVHIVSSRPADFRTVPKPFFLNQIKPADEARVGELMTVSEIATVETRNLEIAFRAFEDACVWSRQQLLLQPNFGVHVKLERITDSRFLILQKPRPQKSRSHLNVGWCRIESFQRGMYTSMDLLRQNYERNL